MKQQTRRRDPALVHMSYPDLLKHYQDIGATAGRGRSSGKTEASLMRDIEAEIKHREEIGDTHGVAVLKLGGCEVEVRVRR